MTPLTRRGFLASVAAAPLAAAAGSTRLPIRKAVEFSMLPASLSVAARFQLARDAGFEETECPTTPDPSQAEEMLVASKASGLRIHSVMNSEHWRSPLSSRDPAVVEKSMAGMRTSLRNAKLWGSDTVLLVPAVVNPETTYAQAWERSQRQIRLLIPMAAELKVVIGVEEVGNKFLLSPLEFARYVDEFESPWLRAYFDVGNIMSYGYPQDWIRTLGKRIIKVHIKDWANRIDPTIKKRVPEYVALLEGEIDWKAVHQAFVDVDYRGTATLELAAGDAEYIRDLSRRFDRILARISHTGRNGHAG